MEYRVRYDDNAGDDYVLTFASKEEAEQAIEEDLENCKQYFIRSGLSYDYADFGNKTEIWARGKDEYFSWERLWIE